MSFLTEYFDEYRQHPIRKTKLFHPENRFAKIEGKWMDPKLGDDDKELTDEEIKKFIKKTMKSLRGQSTYYNEYCAHLPEEFKTRPFKPREKKKRPCKPKSKEEEKVEEEKPAPSENVKLAMKDTELMKMAQALYERDMDKPTLEPLPTHFRSLGYARQHFFKTGISEYGVSTARLAYEMVKNDRIPRYYAHNGARPRWGLPPEGERQPELDGAPYDGERLY